MSSAPVLSIIIVAYKSRNEIAGCLDSLPRALTEGSIEVIVVDNSSGDGTAEIVHGQFPWVTYVAPDKNLGFGRANNLGYAHCDPAGEFVLFLNPDTLCNEAALAHCVRRLREDSTIGLISPRLMLADGSMDLACRRSIPTMWDGFCRASGLAAAFPRTKLFSGYNLTHLPESETYDVGAINGAFIMGRRAVFDAVVRSDKREALSLKPEAGDCHREAREARRGDPAILKPAGLLRPSADAEDLAMIEMENAQLKAYSIPPTASRLPLTAAGTSRPGVFDERFFMYGDDLDLCIRVARAGWRIVYDGRVQITHLKGVSVAKDYDLMSRAIFDANRDVYLKHFADGPFARWGYRQAFAAWKILARTRAKFSGYRRVQPR